MLKPPSSLETQLAQEHSARRLAEFKKRRTNSLLLTLIFGLLVGLALAYDQPMLAFNAIMVSLIFLIRAIDAHGMAQDVRRRPRKTLVVRMPFTERDAPSKTATDPGFSH